MANNINSYKIVTHECNVLSNPLNPTEHEKSKTSEYSPILHGCMNSRSGGERFGKFRIKLYSRSSSTILMGKMMSQRKHKIKPKINTWKTQAGKFTIS